ncbi:hypothetical protein AOQ84DRAFT_358313 [Glonium stellatum]|uniref:Uncharacterized protein n=1 Tax=Glonium stellatum TaxID=574774 RepID=A0A8E2FDS4_9PEZI|nr:hypothetical protein AOQ84DRAFT_358313 [Glonium stellatum]
MTEPEDLDEDLFADLYEGDEVSSKPAPQSTTTIKPEPIPSDPVKQEAPEPISEAPLDLTQNRSNGMNGATTKNEDNDVKMNGASWEGSAGQHYDGGPVENDDNYGPIGIKEDGIVNSPVIGPIKLQHDLVNISRHIQA